MYDRSDNEFCVRDEMLETADVVHERSDDDFNPIEQTKQ